MSPPPSDRPALVWFRRDLRLADHAALYRALRGHARVYCAFVFDTEILDALPSRHDRRVDFIYRSIVELERTMSASGGGLIVRHGRARDEIPRLAAELDVAAVYVNHDYEPQAIERDTAVARALAGHSRALRTFKDQAIFDRDELRTQTGKPYTVFTPYKNAWLRAVDPFYLKSYPTERYFDRLARVAGPALPSLAQIGFQPTDLDALGFVPGEAGAQVAWTDFLTRIDDYAERRNFPAVKGPSYLSVHLRFGTISVRTLTQAAHARTTDGARTWLSELIWRDFYFQILANFPHVVARAFHPAYDAVRFDNDPAKLAAWRAGRTGYPIVDAAMRQLAQTGYMHNRLRMIAASFLVKDLHVHWSFGERHFADALNDFDLAANNGGWQWAASSGTDAQPYFRIFNPVTQSEKFDSEGRFIRRYCPELAQVSAKYIHAPWTMPAADQRAAGCVIGSDYPPPIVDHASARAIALERYSVVKNRGAKP